ncbi:MAG: hypothetical protein AAF600_22540 [Bacteroidota bacterium]
MAVFYINWRKDFLIDELILFYSMARKGRKLILSPEDEKTLIATSKAHCMGHRDVMRSKILLMLH